MRKLNAKREQWKQSAMTTNEDLNQTCSPATAHQDQEVCLLDQIKHVTFGHALDDVLTVAVALLMECVVQKTDSKADALGYLYKIFQCAGDEVANDYSNLKGTKNKVLHYGPTS